MEGKGQTALVTGASSGMGQETAKKLAEKGFQVIAAARRMDRLNELANQVQGIIPKQVDLSNPEDVEKFSSYISSLPEPVSVLINNAGYSIRGALEDISARNAQVEKRDNREPQFHRRKIYLSHDRWDLCCVKACRGGHKRRDAHGTASIWNTGGGNPSGGYRH